MSAKHTPGRVCDACEGFCLQLADTQRDEVVSDLLDALKGFLALDDSFTRGSVESIAELASAGDRLAPVVLKARLAIAKAEGSTP